jgi:hypothetical protein
MIAIPVQFLVMQAQFHCASKTADFGTRLETFMLMKINGKLGATEINFIGQLQ